MQIIGIIGVGMVGGAHKRYFESAGFKVVVYDPPKGFNDKDVLQLCDWIIVCVPTPFTYDRGKSGFDLSFVDEALSILPSGSKVIIKSTVLPGSTDSLQKKYAGLKIVFSPEFLSEATADSDTQHPKRQIVGFTSLSKDIAESALAILPRAPFEKIVPAAVAEMIKYFGNTWYATKVVFANQMYDLCQRLGINYDEVKECVKSEPMIGESHLEIFHKGYRGYGGACLPKDARALIQLGDKVGVDLKLLKMVEKINQELNGRGK